VVNDPKLMEKASGMFGDVLTHMREQAPAMIGASALAAIAGGLGSAAENAIERMRDRHRRAKNYSEMLSANPFLADHDPTTVQRAFNALHSLNPQYASDPFVAGEFVKQTIGQESLNFGGLGAIVKARKDLADTKSRPTLSTDFFSKMLPKAPADAAEYGFRRKEREWAANEQTRRGLEHGWKGTEHGWKVDDRDLEKEKGDLQKKKLELDIAGAERQALTSPQQFQKLLLDIAEGQEKLRSADKRRDLLESQHRGIGDTEAKLRAETEIARAKAFEETNPPAGEMGFSAAQAMMARAQAPFAADIAQSKHDEARNKFLASQQAIRAAEEEFRAEEAKRKFWEGAEAVSPEDPRVKK